MRERAISHEWVERTLERPEFVRPSRTHPGRSLVFRPIDERGRRWLRVVFEQQGGTTTVISAYADHNAEKWR
jgi:hypothetical protein